VTGAAASAGIPTTLGSAMPCVAGAVGKSCPVVGKVVFGPPPPWLVGAVAVDTYWLPRVCPQGYTERGLFTNTDFNSPPRLRHYVNYLAPMPYTHPPVYQQSPVLMKPHEAKSPYVQRIVSGKVDIEY
jgi:hypothetical protein